MTEEAKAAEAEQEVTEGASEAPVSSQETEQTPETTPDRDFETEAREMGWVPESEFNGPKEKWKPAQQFVEDGETILPIVNARNKKLQDRIEKQEADFQKRLDRIERVNKSVREREAKRYETEITRLKQAQRKAAEDGDVDRYDAISQEMEGLAKPEEEPEPQADIATVQKDWVARNEWYTSNFEMADKATRYSQWIAQQNPAITMADNLAQTEAYMKKEHPELFGGKPKKPAANGHAAVDGGSDFPAGSRKGKSAAQLPAEARAHGEQFVKDGLFKSIEEYAKEYFSNE